MAFFRVQDERKDNIVALVMDYPDVVGQARENGFTEEALLARYKSAGVQALAVYESTLGRLVQTSQVVYRVGSGWRNERLSNGQSVENIRSDEYYLRSLVAGVAERFRAKYHYPSRQVNIDGKTWFAYPLDVGGLPAGPDMERINKLQAQGFFLVYRPFLTRAAIDPGSDLPALPYLIYTGDKVVDGDEQTLQQVIERSKNFITGLVEATDQDGILELAKQNKVVRVFSIRPEWQAKLQPEEVASKFVLAARERNHRLLYLRPFQRIEDTEIFIASIKTGLAKAGFVYGQPKALEFEPNKTLRMLSMIGPLVGLLLLATTLPWTWLGVAVAAGTLLLCVAATGVRVFDSFALLAAVVFPTLGFALERNKPFDWVRATLITLAGGLFVSAIGASRNELLALEPFRGVALTLFLPPLLLALCMLPRQDIRKTLKDLWATPVNLGTLALAVLALAAVAVVLMRRGNTPAVGVSASESKIRASLQDSLIRPRSKEVLLHPLALLALDNNSKHAWPVWFGNILLLAAVVGQGSILDSFAHYHTPLLITLLRSVNGIAFGLLLAVVVMFLARFARTFFAPNPVSAGTK